MKISIFGTGYVGLVTGACLANLGHEVLCMDIDQNKVEHLKEKKIPFYEPGLKELVIRNTEKNRLHFTSNPKEAVDFAEAIFNCVGTPERKDGSSDLQFVLEVAELVAKYAQGYKLLINKSTVLPGTARRCHELILSINPYSDVDVVSNPEFLAEGKAVHDFTHPDKIVIGANSSKAFGMLRKIYTGRVRTYIPFLDTTWETAEMIKYANNSFLSTKISFINEVANICDLAGADVKIVAQALGMDYRINPRFLNAGIGYGGSCFPKDVRALSYFAKEKRYEAKLLQEVDAINIRQRSIFFEKVISKYKSINGKIFSIWGVSFKPHTSDLREAPALELITRLLERGAVVKIYDPIAIEEAKKYFENNSNKGNIIFSNSVEESVVGSSGILLITEWDDFRNVHFSELSKEMKEKIIFDGRNIYEPEMVKDEGFEYYGVGRN